MKTYKTDSQYVQEWQGKFDAARAYKRPMETKYMEFLEQYKGILKEDSAGRYRYRSKLFIPSTATKVDGVLAALMMQLVPTSKFFSVTAREPGDNDKSRMVESLLAYQFEEADFFSEFQSFLKQAEMYGTSIGRVYWETIKKVISPDLSVDTASDGKLEEEVIVFDGPVFKAVDWWNFFWDPSCTNLKNGYKIFRYEKSTDELKAVNEARGTEIYKNLDLLAVGEGPVKDGEKQSQDQERKDVMGFTVSGDSLQTNKKNELIECWNEDDTEMCVIANGRVMVRGPIKNPFSHGESGFVRLTYTLFPFEFTGVGIPEKIQDLQQQLNNLTNQRNDNVNIILNRMWKVQRGAGVDTKALASGPNRIIFTNDMAALEELTTPMVTQNAYMETQNIETKMEEATGATKYTIGMGQDTGVGTATEAMIQSQSGQSGFALLLRQIENMALKPIIRMFYQLDQQFMTTEKVVRIIGDEGAAFETVTPQDIIGNYDLIPDGYSTMMRKEVQVRLMTEFLKITAGDPVIDRRTIYKKIWEAWGFKNYEELLSKGPLPPMGPPQSGAQTGPGPGLASGVTGAPMMPGMPGEEVSPEGGFAGQARGGMM